MIEHLIFWSKSIQYFIQPDIAASGGLSEFLKISTIASTFGVGRIFFRMFHMPLSLITNVQINDHNRLKVNVVPHVWGSAAESQKPRQRVSNADRKVFANPESFCDKLIIDWRISGYFAMDDLDVYLNNLESFRMILKMSC